MWEILNRLSYRSLLLLLPYWKEEYYSYIDEQRIEKKYVIDEIIGVMAEISKDQRKLSFLLNNMTDHELKTLFTNIGINSKNDISDINHNIMKVKQIQRQLLSKNSSHEKEKNKSLIAISGGNFYELLDYQLYIKEQIINLINSSTIVPRCIVHMPTGTGKTKTMMHTLINYYQEIAENRALIVWIAHTNTLLQQAENTLINCWQHLGHSELNIYKHYGDFTVVDTLSNGFLFISIQSLLSLEKKNSSIYMKIKDKAAVICFDEAHKCLARQTKIVLTELMKLPETMNNRYFIGLTATPGRALVDNDENDSLAALFENRIISIDCKAVESFRKTDFQMNFFENENGNLISYFQERKILSRLIREEIDYAIDTNGRLMKLYGTNKEDYSKELLLMVSQDVKRNNVIIERLLTLADDGIPTIFFAASVEHGKLISLLLKIKGIGVSQVYGEMNEIAKEIEITKFKNGQSIILVNFNVLTTGFDSTNIKCVFIARPTKSIVVYSQMIGRGLRGPKMGGNEECLLIDIKDNLDRFKNENDSFHYFDEYWR